MIKIPMLVMLTFALGALSFASDPCGTGSFAARPSQLREAETVYDSNSRVCWLADANLAGNAKVRAAVTLSPHNPDGSTPVINPDGTMDYFTAVNWVNSLNSYNHGQGWLNHNNWQLPTTPAIDATCSSINVDNFGAQCTGSAFGKLYSDGLGKAFPDSVVPAFSSLVLPFLNLQPGLYWTKDTNSGGQATFAFNTGLSGGNTTKYNFFHVLPVTQSALGPLPPGKGVLPYLNGPAAGKAVYDTNTGLSWTQDANLPASNNFGFTGTVMITSPVNGTTVTVPLIDKDGAVYFNAIDPSASSGWIVSMNTANYAGTGTWELPSTLQLQHLYADMMITVGDPRLEWPFAVGPFLGLQPGFYWSCVPAGATNGPCNYAQPAPGGLFWTFNFDDGFEGSDTSTKQFYVMVYYPAR